MCVTTLSVYGALSRGRWRELAAGGAGAAGAGAGAGTAGAGAGAGTGSTRLLFRPLGGALYVPLLVVTMIQNEK